MTVVILLGMGGAQVINQRVSLGTFLAFYTFLGQLVFPMIAIGFVTNIFQRGAASMGRLNYILKAQPNIRNSAAFEEEASTKRQEFMEMVQRMIARTNYPSRPLRRFVAKSNFAI